jgi:hypothetical protein
MKISRVFLAAITFLLLSGPLSAQANLVWDWTGDCNGVITPVPPNQGGGSNGCSGRAAAHAVTTDDYIPGTEQRPGGVGDAARGLVEFVYSDMNVTVDLIPDWMCCGQVFQLPASSPDPVGEFNALNAGFESNASSWIFAAEGVRPNCDPEGGICGYDARGFNGVWTRVPAPSTLVLLGFGLAGLTFHRRRKVG